MWLEGIPRELSEYLQSYFMLPLDISRCFNRLKHNDRKLYWSGSASGLFSVCFQWWPSYVFLQVVRTLIEHIRKMQSPIPYPFPYKQTLPVLCNSSSSGLVLLLHLPGSLNLCFAAGNIVFQYMIHVFVAILQAPHSNITMIRMMRIYWMTRSYVRAFEGSGPQNLN